MKFAILIYIFYVVCFDEDLILGIFMLVAFVVTINMDNSIQAAKVTYKSETIARETFVDNENNDDTDDDKKEDYVNDEEDNEKYENMMTDKTLKDTFSVLHQSIHELQKMVDNKNSTSNN
jgi:TATA-binding protein-associated factor Taf7